MVTAIRFNHLIFLGNILFLFLPIHLFSDELILKNGKTISNVKTRITEKSIEVSSENGKKLNYPKGEVKGLKIRAVQWKPPEVVESKKELLVEDNAEKERVAEASSKGDEFIPRASEDEVNPWGNFALGLIPGYSGLYRTDSNVGAITFSVLESIAFLYAFDLYSAKEIKSGFSTPESGGIVLVGSSLPATQNGSIVSIFGIYNSDNYIGYKGGLSGENYVGVARAESAEKSLATQRNSAYGVLGFLLMSDAIVSYFSADSWNEGNYAGESSPDFVKPTTPLSRTFRSVFLPGWGQIYGGNKVKGYSWLVGGIVLLGNVGVKEAGVVGARSAYQKNPSIGGIFAPGSQSQKFFVAYSISEPFYQKLESAVQERNTAWSMYGVFWALNLVDAYFFSGKETVEQKVTILPKFDYKPVAQLGNTVSWEQHLEIQCNIQF